MLAVVVANVLVVGAAGTPAASAQTIDDLRAEATTLDGRLHDTREQLEALAEEFSQAQTKVAEANEEVATSEAALAAMTAAMQARRGELAEYALRAYVDGGAMQELDGLLLGEVDTAGRRLSYLKSAVGDRKTLLDRLRASQQDVEGRIRRVDVARERAQSWVARTEAAQAEAGQLEAELTDLLARTEGRVATLVAEAQAQREAEERAAAEEAARQAGLRIVTAPEPAFSTAARSDQVGQGSTLTEEQPTRQTVPVVNGDRPEATIAVNAALSQLGVPYVWAGASPGGGFDCSGLMYWAWAQAGRSIPRPADYQRDDAIPIRYEDLKPGDLVFYGEPVSHVGMYIGGDQIVDAPQTGDVVQIKTMWYSRKPMTYGRVP